MKKTSLALSIGLIMSLVGPAFATEITLGDAMARVTPRGVGAAFMTISNNSDRVKKVVSAKAKGVGKAELHTHINDNGIMRMRRVENFSVPAGGSHVLQPGGDHVMLFDVSQEVRNMNKIAVTLGFDDGSTSTIEIPIMSMKTGKKDYGQKQHDHHMK